MSSNQRGFIAYGYGNYGRECSRYFSEQNFDVIAFVDKNPFLWGNATSEGYRVISPAEMISYGFDVPIVLCLRKGDNAVEKELRTAGFTNIEKSSIKLDSEGIKEVVPLLADDLSRKVFDVCVNFWETGANAGFTRVFTPGRYFPSDIIEWGENEVFVDVGGYDGIDTQKFIDLTNGKFRHVYLFEPIPNMASLCKEKFNGEPRVSVLQAALGSEVKDIFFCDNAECSKQNSQGTIAVRQMKLDEMAVLPPTMVKFDIEGAELSALIGMKEIITAHKPKLAISLYHKPQDIFEIPLWINENFPFYKLYMRKHHVTEMDEMVLYCVSNAEDIR